MKAQFTPGPWKRAGLVIKGEPYKWPLPEPDAVPAMDATVVAILQTDAYGYRHYPYEIAEANARLITAAPNLLATLHAINEKIERLLSDNDMPEAEQVTSDVGAYLEELQREIFAATSQADGGPDA